MWFDAGVTVFAYIMSTVSSLLTTLNSQSMHVQEQQQQLESFCRTHKIPPALSLKLKRFFDYVLPKQVQSDDVALVQSLSASLRQQVRSDCP